MNQSKLESLFETCINIASGFVLAMLITEFVVVPLWGLDWNTADNFAVTSIFTVTAIIRGYFWRRFFNAGVHKVVHRWVTG